MDPTTIAAITATSGAIIAALFGYIGSKFARRKEKADAAAVVTATAISLLAPLNTDIAKLSGQVAAQDKELARLAASVASLEQDNKNLRSENTGLRVRVTALEDQIRALGHTPVNGTPPMGTVTTSTTETVTHPIATEGKPQ